LPVDDVIGAEDTAEDEAMRKMMFDCEQFN
jgi:hypothetical protein